MINSVQLNSKICSVLDFHLRSSSRRQIDILSTLKIEQYAHLNDIEVNAKIFENERIFPLIRCLSLGHISAGFGHKCL